MKKPERGPVPEVNALQTKIESLEGNLARINHDLAMFEKRQALRPRESRERTELPSATLEQKVTGAQDDIALRPSDPGPTKDPPAKLPGPPL